jgi:hypothetical protein
MQFISFGAYSSQYQSLLDSYSLSVGQRIGENLIVEESCVDPSEDPSICQKTKYVTALPGRTGRVEYPINAAGDFDVSMSLDPEISSGGAEWNESLVIHSPDGSSMTLLVDGEDGSRYSDCRSSGIGDTGGHTEVNLWKSGYLAGYISNDFRISVVNGVATCFCNGTEFLSRGYPFPPVPIYLAEPHRNYDRLVIAGINDRDRLYEVKVRGLEITSCNSECGSTQTYGNGITISAIGKPEISAKGGFVKLDVTSGLDPNPDDCSLASHDGRMVLDNLDGTLFVCKQGGWIENR